MGTLAISPEEFLKRQGEVELPVLKVSPEEFLASTEQRAPAPPRPRIEYEPFRAERFNWTSPITVRTPETVPAGAIDIGRTLEETGFFERKPPVEQKPAGLKDIALGFRAALGETASLPARMTAQTAGAPPVTAEIAAKMEQDIAPTPEEMEGRTSLGSQLLQGIGRLPVDIPKYVGLTALSGGSAPVGFAVASGLESASRGEAPTEALKSAAEGAVLGGIYTKLGPYRRLVKVPIATGATYGAAKVAGATDEEALSSAILMGGLTGLHGRRGHPARRAPERTRTEGMVMEEPAVEAARRELALERGRVEAPEPPKVEPSAKSAAESAEVIERAMETPREAGPIAEAMPEPTPAPPPIPRFARHPGTGKVEAIRIDGPSRILTGKPVYRVVTQDGRVLAKGTHEGIASWLAKHGAEEPAVERPVAPEVQPRPEAPAAERPVTPVRAEAVEPAPIPRETVSVPELPEEIRKKSGKLPEESTTEPATGVEAPAFKPGDRVEWTINAQRRTGTIIEAAPEAFGLEGKWQVQVDGVQGPQGRIRSVDAEILKPLAAEPGAQAVSIPATKSTPIEKAKKKPASVQAQASKSPRPRPEYTEGDVFRGKAGTYRVTQITENEVSYEFTGKRGNKTSASMPTAEFEKMLRSAEPVEWAPSGPEPTEVEAARARLKARAQEFLKSEKGEQSLEWSAEDLQADLHALTVVGRDLFQRGAHRLEDWKRQMIETFGEWISERLDDVWAAVQKVSGRAFTRKGGNEPGFLVRRTGDVIELDEAARHYNMVRDLPGEIRRGAVRGRGNGIEYSAEADPATLRIAVKRVADRYPEVFVDGPEGSFVYDSADLVANRYNLHATKPARRISRGWFGEERGSFSGRPIEQPEGARTRRTPVGPRQVAETTPPATPSETYALEMIRAREAARRAGEPTFLERIRALKTELKTKFVDSTAPILDAIDRAQRKYGFRLLPRYSIDAQIDRVYRAPSIAARFIEERGLLKIIQEVDNLDYLDQYLIAKQARAIEATGRKTGRNLQKDAELIQEFAPRYEPYAEQIRQYTHALLDYAADADLISKRLAQVLKETYPDYVPLNRVFSAIEKGESILGGGKDVAHLSRQTVVRRLHGSEREIESPFQSLVEKTYSAFAEGERNKAARLLASYRDLPGMKGLITEVSAGERPSRHSFSFLDNGVKRTFNTTPELAAAAKSLHVQQLGLIGRILAAPVRVAKLGITGINLPFLASNVAADVGHTALTAMNGRTVFNPRVYLRGFLAAVKHDELWRQMVRSGSGFTSYDLMRNQPRKAIEKIRASRSTKTRMAYAARHPIETVGDLFRAVEDLVGRSEELGRARLYTGAKEAFLEQGRPLEDAEVLARLEANYALPNYLRAGEWGRALNGAFLYLNAGIQGSRSFLRAVRRNPVKTSARVATALYFPVTIATLWNLADEERRKVYEDIEEYEKENNLILIPPVPTKTRNNEWEVIKIKLPPGLNNLTVPVRRGIEAMHGLDPVKFREIADAAIGTVSPIEPTKRSILSNLTLQAIKPTVQAAANYDFFRDRPKVSPALQGRPPSMQVYPFTSGTARKIAEPLGVSPIKVEEFLKDTFGGVASQALNISDRALSAAGVIPKEQIGGRDPLRAIAARFSRARGGRLEKGEFEEEKQISKKTLTATAKALNPVAERDMIRLRVGFGAPQRKEDEPLGEYEKRSEIRGKFIAQYLNILVNYEGYAAASDEEKAEALKEAIRAGSQEAGDIFNSEEYKELNPDQKIRVLNHIAQQL